MKKEDKKKYSLAIKDNKLAVIDINNGIICNFDEIPESSKLLDLNDLPSNILKNPMLYIKNDKIDVYPDFDIKHLKKIDYKCELYNIYDQMLYLVIDEMQQAIMNESGISRNYFGSNLINYIK